MENFSMLDFNYFDVAIGAIVLILAIKGFMNGFVKEVFALAGIVLGVYVASKLSEDAGQFIEANFFQLENPSLSKLIGFMAILIIVWLTATILGSIFSKLTSESGLGFLNRLLGFVVGGGKYFIIFALIVTALSNISLVKDNAGKYVNDSLLYPYLEELGAYLINLDPAMVGLDNLSKEEIMKKVKETIPSDLKELTDANL